MEFILFNYFPKWSSHSVLKAFKQSILEIRGLMLVFLTGFQRIPFELDWIQYHSGLYAWEKILSSLRPFWQFLGAAAASESAKAKAASRLECSPLRRSLRVGGASRLRWREESTLIEVWESASHNEAIFRSSTIWVQTISFWWVNCLEDEEPSLFRLRSATMILGAMILGRPRNVTR